MKKIPTIFLRNPAGRITDQVNPACEWVLSGEGEPTLKLDGTCCMVRGGHLFKRRELRRGEPAALNFQQVGFDEETGKTVGWVPVGQGPEDKYHREALAETDRVFHDGTYELVGPRVQGNPERALLHTLIPHGVKVTMSVPRTFQGLRSWLAGKDMEGIVFHHPDGRMAKIKLRDFGLERTVL